MQKIPMSAPIVEMDGDEMTRVLWRLIKERLILPNVELKSEYYDLGLPSRNRTGDQVTVDAAMAAKKHAVAVKCATITPNKQRMEEFPELTQMWKSPNATIRSILDGTVFRVPIATELIQPAVRTWKTPITIARHAYGDVYLAAELATRQPGDCYMTFVGEDGQKCQVAVHSADGPALWLAQHNTDKSIRSFARSCFEYALETQQDLWFSAKDTISKTYDGRFKAIFEEEFQAYKDRFKALGIEYFYTLIDDAAARVIHSEGGFIWACKNYDGDVMSDMIASAFGSLAMMTSVVASPNGCFIYEAAHGTITRHYYRHLNGMRTSTNPIATIFAWSGALRRRGALDKLPSLVYFANMLEKASLDVLKSNIMTADLAGLVKPGVTPCTVDTMEFIGRVSERLQHSLEKEE